ncbi:MAG TPA: hypothetical protein VK402_08505 [Blastococcus sp.]|nr:hypothetical protein [Blastococcus sp.]
MGRGGGRHARRPDHRIGGLVLGLLLMAVLVVVVRIDRVGEPVPELPAARTTAGPADPPTANLPPAGATAGPSTAELPVVEDSPYAGVGTWLSRYRVTREFGGAAPVVTPADVDAMADAGVHTLYLQPAADDPRYPGLLSTDLLGEFLVRAHARGMSVVAWYLPRFGDIAGDLRRLRDIAAFRSDGEGFDAVAVDIEFTEAVELAPRNAQLIELSRQLRAALPHVELGAIVLPPVVTDVLNPAFWPEFPWQELWDLYDVWLPMAYWSNRSEEGFTDPHRYVSENIERVRAHLGDPCAVVSVIGGYDVQETADDYAAMVRAAGEQHAVGVSIWDWPTTPPSAWPALQGYDVPGC